MADPNETLHGPFLSFNRWMKLHLGVDHAVKALCFQADLFIELYVQKWKTMCVLGGVVLSERLVKGKTLFNGLILYVGQVAAPRPAHGRVYECPHREAAGERPWGDARPDIYCQSPRVLYSLWKYRARKVQDDQGSDGPCLRFNRRTTAAVRDAEAHLIVSITLTFAPH